MSVNNIARQLFAGLRTRLASLLQGGRGDSTISPILKSAVGDVYFGLPGVVGAWPASSAAALSAIGFGTSWDAGYDLDVASGSPTNTFGATALTAEGTVTYGGEGPFGAGDLAVRVQVQTPQIRETINAASGTSNPSTTAATQVNDLVICVFFGQTGAPTVASGFTNIVAPFLGSGSSYMGVAYKVATSGGAVAYAPYTFSGGSASVSLIVIQGGTFDISLLASATANAFAAAPADPPSVTSYSDGLLLAIGGIELTAAQSGPNVGAPSGYLSTTTQSGSSPSQHAVARIPTDITASVDPGTMTWGGAGTVQAWYAATIALGPSTSSAGKAASSSPFDATSGDVVVAWLAHVAEGNTTKSGYIVDKLSATNGYAIELVSASGVPKIKFSADTTALNTVSVDVPRGQWHVGIATYVGSTGVMTLGTKALGGGPANTGTVTDASHSGLTSSETFRLDVGRGDLLVRGLLIGASGSGARAGTLNTTGNMGTALESLRQAVLAAASTNYTATLTETVSLSESLATLRGSVVPLAETVTLSESVATIRGAVVPLAETVTLSEALASVFGAVVPLAETVTLTESATTAFSVIVALAETVTLSESLAIVRATFVALAETVTLSEAIGVSQGNPVALAETVTLSESLSTTFGIVAALAETVTVSEALATLAAYFPAITETVTLAEALAAGIQLSASLAETVTLSEAIAVVRSAVVPLAETVTVSESLATLAAYVASLPETVSLAELLAAGIALTATVAETVTLSESLAVARGAVVPLAESVGLSEAFATAWAASVALAETVTLSEAILVGRQFLASLSETVTLSEAIALGVRAFLISVLVGSPSSTATVDRQPGSAVVTSSHASASVDP